MGRLGKRRRRRPVARAADLAGALVAHAARPPNNDEVLFAIGQLHARLLSVHPPADVVGAEFKVFSQFGEDGIIQHLVGSACITSELFVEIGVEDYTECNTRFLLTNNNWRGIIVDGGEDHVERARKHVGWHYSVDAVQEFVTAENINSLLPDEQIGLLSIDVDGNDFWLWKAVSSFPEIVVIEYNSIFGPEALVSVPYDPKFSVTDAHWSGQYHGASLGALNHLANQKGYQLVGATTEGVNAFFVRDDCLGPLIATSVAESWRPSRFRTSRNQDGELSFLSRHSDRLELIDHLPLVDVRTGETTTVRAACSAERRPS